MIPLLNNVEDSLPSVKRKRAILEVELSLLRKCTNEYITRAVMREYLHIRLYIWIRDVFVCLGAGCAAIFVALLSIQELAFLISKIPPEPRSHSLVLLAIASISSAAVAWLINKEIRLFISEIEVQCDRARKDGEAKKIDLDLEIERLMKGS
jgi:hypothetical protein